MSVAARTVDDLLGLQGYYQGEIKKIDDLLKKLNEKREQDRQLWRLECDDEGVEFGTPLEEYPERLQKKMWAIRDRYRREADPLEEQGEKLLKKLMEVKRVIERIDSRNVTKKASSEMKTSAEGSIQAAEGNVFKKVHNAWKIQYGGELIPLRHYTGLSYISYLLQHQKTHFSPLDLAKEVGDFELTGEILSEQDLPESTHWGGVKNIDEDYKRNVERTLGFLNEKIEMARQTGNVGEEEKLEHEKEGAIKQFSKDIGRGGRSRTTGDTCEKERKRVSAAINRSLDEIKKVNERLYQHLKNSIYLGDEIHYTPEEPTDWET